MTKEEFETGYAERSGVTVEFLRENGQQVVPCDCGDETCKGWAMAGPSLVQLMVDTGLLPSALFSQAETSVQMATPWPAPLRRDTK